MQIHHKEELVEALADADLTDAIAEGFIAYSEGRAQVPAPGELVFEDPAGEVLRLNHKDPEQGDNNVVHLRGAVQRWQRKVVD